MTDNAEVAVRCNHLLNYNPLSVVRSFLPLSIASLTLFFGLVHSHPTIHPSHSDVLFGYTQRHSLPQLRTPIATPRSIFRKR